MADAIVSQLGAEAVTSDAAFAVTSQIGAEAVVSLSVPAIVSQVGAEPVVSIPAWATISQLGAEVIRTRILPPVNYEDPTDITAPRIVANVTHTIYIGPEILRLPMPTERREAPRVRR
jgi:hypothetical protein